ncbi:unnamed protein product [Miscanthus lutarioriparius]|uniref:Uncharacterized protein n=1 Tax=Miscanthus lutarioriparius TaxID=422564 RepID=A0A811PHD4_9POAL|nr:unnamed protein product [Miscanthus lutarioriparius]
MARVSSKESISASIPRSAVCSAYGRRRRRQKPVGGQAGRCNAVLKQHKTRLYILGKCVSMLLCWHDHDAD